MNESTRHLSTNFNAVEELTQWKVAYKGDIKEIQDLCHALAAQSGWWTDVKTGEDLSSPSFADIQDPSVLKINVPEKLMLCVSEAAEAMEGFRKNLMDDKLPNRMMLEVELADMIIRAFDLAGGLGLNLGDAMVEKMIYNAHREDHKIENRMKEGGKAF